MKSFSEEFSANNKQLQGSVGLDIVMILTNLLYRPSELRSSRISAWWSSSRVSMHLGWILGALSSWCLQLSCSMAGPEVMSPPGSRGE